MKLNRLAFFILGLTFTSAAFGQFSFAHCGGSPQSPKVYVCCYNSFWPTPLWVSAWDRPAGQACQSVSGLNAPHSCVKGGGVFGTHNNDSIHNQCMRYHVPAGGGLPIVYSN